MKHIHDVKIIESGQFSTARLFELGLSFEACKRAGKWPSLKTMNGFLLGGADEGALGTDVQWHPVEIDADDYREAIDIVMGNAEWKMDESSGPWEEWFGGLPNE